MFKFAVLITLCVMTSSSFIQSKLTSNEDVFWRAADYVAGFLVALEFKDKVPSAETCDDDHYHLNDKLNAAVELINQGGVDNFVHGVQQIADALNQVVQDCGDFEVELNHYLADLAAVVQDPDFRQNAEQNLYTQAEAAGRNVAESLKNYKEGDYWQSGFYAGRNAHIALYGN